MARIEPEFHSAGVIAVDVVILGGSISALMAASYLKCKLPDLDVAVVGPPPDEEKRPIVGESMVEPAAIFFDRIGMGDYLRREHALKNSLSFYHKLAPEDPSDRRYSVHAPEQLHHLSRQLHRPRFDNDLREHAKSLRVRFLEGKATEIEIGSCGKRHRIAAKFDSQDIQLSCRWVIDATGRCRLLGRKVTTYVQPKERQRSCFWFRLADFEPFTNKIDVAMRRPLKYELWYTTHHFMGHGNWVWGIPLQSREHSSLISVGITFRPDLLLQPMRTVDDFLAFMDTEHSVVAEMVRSGTVLDTHTYGNYLYWAEQVYSPDGWFLIGDAARAVDPLYSTGLSMTVVQVEQIGEIISRQLRRKITAKDVSALERLWMSIARQRQEDITDQYASMHRPFEACMRRYWNVSTWFNAILPLWWNGVLHDIEAAPYLANLFEQGRPMQASARKLIAQASDYLGNRLTQAEFDKAVDFDWLLNTRFDCRKEQVADHFGRLFSKRAAFRKSLLKMAPIRSRLMQAPYMFFESFLARVIPRWLRLAAPGAFGKH